MKNAELIEKEILSKSKYIQDNIANLSDAKYKREKNIIEFLKDVKNYMLSNPTEEFLKAERERVVRIIESKTEQFSYWKKHLAPKDVDPKKWKSIYNKEVGITKLNKQLKTLEFILR